MRIAAIPLEITEGLVVSNCEVLEGFGGVSLQEVDGLENCWYYVDGAAVGLEVDGVLCYLVEDYR